VRDASVGDVSDPNKHSHGSVMWRGRARSGT